MEQSLDFIRSDSWKAARLRGAILSKRHSQPLELIKELTGQSWAPEDSAQVYNVEGWGAPYFSVTDRGTLFVRPTDEECGVDLHDLVRTLQAQGLHTPMLVRFLDIIGDRIKKLHDAFEAAIDRFEYQGEYRGIFPVKCNHDKELVSSVIEYGRPFGFGLEVGSKTELVMVMSLLAQFPGANLICNGYKDKEYMELVLHCRQLGINAMVVMEQYSELEMLLEVSQHMGVRPAIGIRAKLNTQHAGHWGSTSGDRAKFGLRVREIVSVVQQLRDVDMLDCLQLLHFHSGSQITSIREVKEVMRESSFLYAELVQMGANMKFIDVGGGLAVDYDGSFTDTHASMSYTLQNYANDVVSAMQEVCIQRGIDAPTIMSESGRALASHHAVIVFDVLSKPHELHEMAKRKEEGQVLSSVISGVPEDPTSPRKSLERTITLTHQMSAAARQSKGQFLLLTFKEVFDNITADAASLREAYTDATYFKDEAQRAFKLGILSLEERAQIETMYDATCQHIRDVAHANHLPIPISLRPTSTPGPKTMYHINLSVFRSAIDTWAIDQVFPLMPIHRLDEEPRVLATLADLTCDSDGKVDKFPNPIGGDPLPAVPLHETKNGDDYFLALFLTGVYQEIMGSIHNGFGSLNTVVIKTQKEVEAEAGDGSKSSEFRGQVVGDGFAIDRVVRGQTIAEVLENAHHHGGEMTSRLKAAMDDAMSAGRLDAQAASHVMDTYTRRMASYTYMN